MGTFTYIRFNNLSKKTSSSGGLKRTIESAIIRLLGAIIPKSNPDFDHVLDKVEYWKIEYNENENTTWREIGFDKDGFSIVAMPLGPNYGYWTDNNLTLDDYELFEPIPISAEEFDKDWREFEKGIGKTFSANKE